MYHALGIANEMSKRMDTMWCNDPSKSAGKVEGKERELEAALPGEQSDLSVCKHATMFAM